MALWHFHGNIDPEYKESVIITLQMQNQPIVKILKICFPTSQYQKKKLYLAGQYRTLKFYLKRNNLHYKNYI